MKSFLRICFILVALLSLGCQDQFLQDQSTLNRESLRLKNPGVLNADLLQTKSTLKENGLPELTFKTNENGKPILILKDQLLAGSDLPSLGKIKLTQFLNGKIAHTIEDSFAPGHTVRLRLPNLPASGTLVQVEIQYFKTDGVPVKSYNYDAFVLPDGSGALQQPKHTTIRIAGTAHFVDDWQGETSMVIENDPAGIVTAVQVRFNEPFIGPKPIETIYNLKKALSDQKWNFHVWNGSFLMTGDPTGFFYNLTFSFVDAAGKQIGESFTQDVVIEKADFTGRIRRVRMISDVANADAYRIIGTVEGDSKGEVASLDIKFKEPFPGAAPAPSQIIAPFKSANEENGNRRFVFDAVTFGGGERPVGKTYTVVAIMLNSQGRPLANPVTLDVVIEGSDVKEPLLLSTSLTSKDGGATWDITVTLEDKGQWVEKVVYEFAKPYAGPAPLVNPITLVRTGEASGNIEVYTATGIKFEKNPVGSTYSAIVYGFGSGTRTSSGQANNKAELL